LPVSKSSNGVDSAITETFKNEKQKIKLIDKKLQHSEIYEDDINSLKMIMDILTKKDETWKSMLANDEN
jgi:hypothetical protein